MGALAGLESVASASLWLKAAGALFTMVAGTGAGWVVAQSLTRRPIELQQCLEAISLLETEIAYRNLSLPEAWDRVADRVAAPLNYVLREAAQRLRSGGGVTVGTAWEAALETLRAESVLPPADREILRQLGPFLDGTGKDDQHRSLVWVRQELEEALAQARADQEKNARLWRYLGFAAGAALVLVLI